MRIVIVLLLALASIAPRSAAPVGFAPGVISTGHEFAVTFTPDGREVYFTRSTVSPRANHVMHSVMRDGAWQPAEAVSFSGDTWSDLDPALSPDGMRLYFISTRPRPSHVQTSPSAPRDMDIWYADRVGDQWGAPHWIEELSSDAKEGSPTVDRDGTLCFFSDRGATGGNNAIYCAARLANGWSAPSRLNANVNAGPSDTSPFLSRDGKTLLFYSTRDGGMGKADLYISVKRDDVWQPATSLGSVVNGPEFEYNPSVAPDGRSFFFGRTGNVYVIPVSELDARVITPAMFK
jgi:Tol biopolymer transport system component